MPLLDDPPPDGGGGGGGGKKKKLTALLDETPELQDEIDELIERRLARERRKLQGKGGNKEEAEELERLRTEASERERKDAEKQKDYDKALNTEREKFGKKEKGWKEREDKLTAELRRDRVRAQLVGELARQNANDPEAYADILEKRVKFDTETFRTTVVDDRDPDKEATDKDGEPLTLKALVAGWIQEKPWAAKAAEGDSANARGGDGTDKGKGGSKGEIGQLEQRVTDAIALAEKSPTAGNLTKVSQAKRALKQAQAKAA